jgi:cell division initiation protein
MTLTALEIKQQRFRARLRGVDPQEVEAFLEQAAGAFEELQRENHRLSDEVKRQKNNIEEYKRREGTFKIALLNTQKVIDQMKANARKNAELIVGDAEIKAAKLLQQAQKRFAQLQDDITELKRQRVQLEVDISAVIESHRRLLAVREETAKTWDEKDDKVKVLKPSA